MTPPQKIARLVQAKNEEIEAQAKVEVGVGLAFSGLVFGFFFVFCYILGYIAVDSPFLFAFGLTAALAGLSFLVVWRTVDPTRKIVPMDSPREVTNLLAGGTPNALFFSARHDLPGGVSFLMSGPENIVRAYGMRAHKLPSDRELFERCVQLLPRCETGYSLRKMKQPQAPVLLRQLGLVRVEGRDAGPTLVLTGDGQTVLDQL